MVGITHYKYMNTHTTIKINLIGDASALLSANHIFSMGSHRMFSDKITESSSFLKMPRESQLLYFHLGMNADDDGVVEAYKVLKMTGIDDDAYSLLMLRGFIVQLNNDQVVFVRDWHEHNIIRADRLVPSIYRNLLQEVVPDVFLREPKARSDVGNNSRRIGGRSTDGLSKDKLSKDNINTQPTFFDVLDTKIVTGIDLAHSEGDRTVESVFENTPEGLKRVSSKILYPEDFEKFWNLYPKTRKAGKTIPYEKWQKLTPEQRVLVLDDVEARSTRHTGWLKENGAFVPAPEVYLNKKKEYWLQPIIEEPKKLARAVH